MINQDVEKVIASKEQIEKLCEELGKRITKDYEGKRPIFVGLLKGCQPFMGDLIKHVIIPCEVDYMKVSSYAGTHTLGEITIKKDIDTSIAGRDVIIVDDVVDSGITIASILKMFKDRGANSLQVCALLDKPEGRKVDVNVKYFGMPVPNEFVVGYGLDYNELYRNLPYIGVLKKEIYQK